MTGLAFCLSLRSWEYCAATLTVSRLMILTYWLELLLLVFVLVTDGNRYASSLWSVLLLGFASGIYNSFFWTTQRALFLDLISTQNSGRQYGNFQLFVGVFLKGGIFLGGVLLEHLGFPWVFITTTCLIIAITVYLLKRPIGTHRLASQKPVTVGKLKAFKDQYHSRTIFISDGLFLFLESHFWTISLFLLTDQDFARLSIIVILLAVMFAVLFFIAKNTIDRLMGKRLFIMAVVLYAASWFLRAVIDPSLSIQWLFLWLSLITFFSSFFRLSFNKRFYDVALETTAREYLLIKSYYTQCFVVLFFTSLAALAAVIGDDVKTLGVVYLVAGVLALSYGRYQYKP